VQEGLDALDQTMDEFLLANTGETLTAMAEILDVPAQAFIQVYEAWVRDNAPPLLE
jgi:hypothetical protein